MRATPDEFTGLASGVNNAVARAAGLIAVAALGAMAGTIFRNHAPTSNGLEFGAENTIVLSPADNALRIAATNNAFWWVAMVAAAACFLAAAIAWWTQPSIRRAA